MRDGFAHVARGCEIAGQCPKGPFTGTLKAPATAAAPLYLTAYAWHTSTTFCASALVQRVANHTRVSWGSISG